MLESWLSPLMSWLGVSFAGLLSIIAVFFLAVIAIKK